MQIRFDARDWFKGGPRGVTSRSTDTALYAILGSNLLTLGIAWW